MQYPASNGKITDLLCGSPDGGCTPKLFVDYIGNNPLAPFVFNVNITDDPFNYNSTVQIIPVNTTMFVCSEKAVSPNFEASACGCADCIDSCPVPKPPPIEKHCILWGFECFTVVSAILFLVFSLAFLVSLLLFSSRTRLHSSQDQLVDECKLDLIPKLGSFLFIYVLIFAQLAF